jgi:alkanesulfonate monooxygenase SsuD/methylene tetrahydromethanopterin reductase-like flavin-dependent oxidoreductase (luciferase family)
LPLPAREQRLYDFVPEQEEQGIWEVFTVLSALAAVTTRITLGTIVACTSFRPLALVAKMADTLDEISGGRLILGLGAGWHQPEYEAFGDPFDHLASRFEEAIQIIGPLLREGQVNFPGIVAVLYNRTNRAAIDADRHNTGKYTQQLEDKQVVRLGS